MIVRAIDGELLLISQPDHAHAAGEIMEYCVPLASKPRREEILHAITEHDNGWAEEDAAPKVDAAGKVVDFVNAPLSVRHGVWPRGVSRLDGDPWAAALVAQHAITVYDRFRPAPEWTSFFTRMEAARDALVLDSGLTIDELKSDYAFVRLADLISLTFCAGWTDEQRFGEWTVVLDGSRVLVSPDPFGGTAVPFDIQGKRIPDRPYRSDDALRAILKEAGTTRLQGEVAGR